MELTDLLESDIFSTLMGDNIETRRRFIEENALDVRNLDLYVALQAHTRRHG